MQGTIQRYLHLEEDLLAQLIQLKKQKTNVGAELMKAMLSELGGALAKDALESVSAGRHAKKLTRSYLTQQQQMQLSAKEKTISDQHDINLRGIRSFLLTISERRPNLAESNSKMLISKLEKAQEFAKLESRIRRTTVFLQSIANKDLVLNSDLPRLMEERQRQCKEAKIEPHSILKDLETKLRQGIQIRLQSLSSNWWTERIPDDVKRRAEERKTKDEKPWPWYERRDLDLIFYVDFADYVKIIRKRDNWEQVFKPVFRDEEIISSKLRELEPLRNAIAHSRQLTSGERGRLNLLAADIVSCLEK